MEILRWPLQLASRVVGAIGRVLALVLGLVLLLVGALLTVTAIGAIVGIPLLIVGALLVVRALF